MVDALWIWWWRLALFIPTCCDASSSLQGKAKVFIEFCVKQKSYLKHEMHLPGWFCPHFGLIAQVVQAQSGTFRNQIRNKPLSQSKPKTFLVLLWSLVQQEKKS